MRIRRPLRANHSDGTGNWPKFAALSTSLLLYRVSHRYAHVVAPGIVPRARAGATRGGATRVYDNYITVRSHLPLLKTWIDKKVGDLKAGRTPSPERTFAYYWIKNGGEFQSERRGLRVLSQLRRVQSMG